MKIEKFLCDREGCRKTIGEICRGAIHRRAPDKENEEVMSDANENLADYLLRNQPPTWNYAHVLELARKVAASEGQPTDWYCSQPDWYCSQPGCDKLHSEHVAEGQPVERQPKKTRKP